MKGDVLYLQTQSFDSLIHSEQFLSRIFFLGFFLGSLKAWRLPCIPWSVSLSSSSQSFFSINRIPCFSFSTRMTPVVVGYCLVHPLLLWDHHHLHHQHLSLMLTTIMQEIEMKQECFCYTIQKGSSWIKKHNIEECIVEETALPDHLFHSPLIQQHVVKDVFTFRAMNIILLVRKCSWELSLSWRRGSSV